MCHRCLGLAVLFCLVFSLSGAATDSTTAQVASQCSPGISFGDSVPCSITTPSEIDTYTFTANADDKVLIRMTRTAGIMAPEVPVYDPRGAFLCTTWADSLALIGSCAIPTTGGYTILVNDSGTDQTGDYTVYIQRLNNPGGTTPLAFGQPLPGALSTVGKQDTYTFTAHSGDKVLIRMTRMTGVMAPEVTVYDPRGAFLCTTWGDSIALIGSCAISAAGTYTILANDRGTDQTGDYTMYLGCANVLCGPQRDNVVYLPLLLN